jgi:hypothetical protein
MNDALSSERHLVEPCPGDHIVQFYGAERDLIRAVCRYVRAGLEAGDGVLVIATMPHLHIFAAGLRDPKNQMKHAVIEGRLVFLDATSTLARLFEGGRPDQERVGNVLGPIFAALSKASISGRVRAFGELSSLLARNGQVTDALYLEEMSSAVLSPGVSLMCAYQRMDVPRTDDGLAFLSVCQAHNHVLQSDEQVG